MEATKRVGSQTVKFQFPPQIISTFSIVGPKEGNGPLGSNFDKILQTSLYNEQTWEKAEQKILQESIEMAIDKGDLTPKDINYLLAGDLLNQIISANFTARALGIPFLGIFGACSTMIEGLGLGSMIIDGGFANHVVVGASSHYDKAERQFRFPTELGTQRPLTAQWTVTGAGAAVLGRTDQQLPRITYATTGKVVDKGIKDANDMGAAMAPAVADTIVTHLQDTGRDPDFYDLIISGDLGMIGKVLCERLVKEQGYDISGNYTDCGVLIFDPTQDTHAGGSGCACVATVLSGYILKKMIEGKYKKIFVIGSGALLSPTSTLQGESIPGIGHGVAIEM